ncbi:TPA: hypothetical protein DCZ31_04135 [Patescibacteria group bacterium]|nr:hypothetical protein [Candidatus Gracilibacteria bacterium]
MTEKGVEITDFINKIKRVFLKIFRKTLLKNQNYAITETFSHFFSALFLSVLAVSSEFQIAATAFLVIV